MQYITVTLVSWQEASLPGNQIPAQYLVLFPQPRLTANPAVYPANESQSETVHRAIYAMSVSVQKRYMETFYFSEHGEAGAAHPVSRGTAFPRLLQRVVPRGEDAVECPR